MEDFKEKETHPKLEMHSFAMSGDKEVYIALDELPVHMPDPFRNKNYRYETMIFPGNSETKKVDWGTELLQERYETPKEAVARTKDIAKHLLQGYTVEEIPPQNFNLEVVEKPQKVNGIPLEKYDSVLKGPLDEVLTIAKTSQNPKDASELTVYARLDSEDPFLPSPSGKHINEIVPPSTFLKSVDLYKQQKEIEKCQEKMGKEDYVAINKRLAFTKSIEGPAKVVVDSYEPLSAIANPSHKGIYHLKEKTYEKGNFASEKDKGFAILTWEELKGKAQQEFKMIEQAKSQKFMYLPGNTTLMMPADITRQERNPRNHTAPERASFRKKGIHRKPSGKSMER